MRDDCFHHWLFFGMRGVKGERENGDA